MLNSNTNLWLATLHLECTFEVGSVITVIDENITNGSVKNHQYIFYWINILDHCYYIEWLQLRMLTHCILVMVELRRWVSWHAVKCFYPGLHVFETKGVRKLFGLPFVFKL